VVGVVVQELLLVLQQAVAVGVLAQESNGTLKQVILHLL
jgi:hypothetical protein